MDISTPGISASVSFVIPGCAPGVPPYASITSTLSSWPRNLYKLRGHEESVDVIEAYGGTPGAHPGITNDTLAEMPGVDMSTYPSGVTSD